MDIPGFLIARLSLAAGLGLLATACAAFPVAPVSAPLPTSAPAALIRYVSPTPTPVATAVPPTATPSATPSPTVTPSPSVTPTPLPPTSTPAVTTTAAPSPTPDPARFVNGVRFEAIARLPEETVGHIREVYAHGQALGRDPHAFSKLGDSAILVESNLTRFDRDAYVLGPYASLQAAIDHYAGSFGRYGEATRLSLTAIGANDPMFADKEVCDPGETMLACEFRLHNPSVLIIRLGTNDGDAGLYATYMRRIVDFSLENGVIPVLSTKADRFEGDNSINRATRQIAEEAHVPLLDFDRLAATLPGRGLGDDHAHLTLYRHNDYTDPETFNRGYPMSDLATLIMLDALREALAQP